MPDVSQEDPIMNENEEAVATEEEAFQNATNTSEAKEQGNNNENDPNRSALQDNIATKGKNAYYFAHAHKATGPKWDGKIEPKLLAKKSSRELDESQKRSSKQHSFQFHKSNITKYAFCDEGKSVKLYIDMEGVGEKCTDDDVQFNYTESSFDLVVQNYAEEDQCLCFGKLTAPITKATCKKKANRLVVSLRKENEEKEWHTINDKGSPDHEIV
mmetsp:Transcript_29014/g.44607  ORF Transcript_29014/g.44607 Transcript_29014/m.44607 type:complete len:214 (-) Transcript_29014:80-721(-)|eukprot:CAMPEP_0195293218 /NCGR_PEP_ID=MMETSP0707-20130614/11997_1 /TAXON_ID=33640 /ORGANISM="Asterionellopsis glacialis, Strain CCMP134" /LENGTH=213 /DNA_ID=CAMNT_0040353883 /DNA_START=45 /DNA_END=686 /DNA_ORIENTATION=-